MQISLPAGPVPWVAAAADYLSRGTAVTVTPDAAVSVTDDTPTKDGWAFTDAAGDPLSRSAWVRAAVAGFADAVIVQVRSGDRILAQGRTDVRRSVAGTVAVALTAAGPLLEMAAAAAVPELPAVDRTPDAVPGGGVTAARAQAAFAGRLSRAAVTYRQWGIARLPGPAALDDLLAGHAPAVPLTWHSPPPDHFWADPVVVSDRGRTWVFVEELSRQTGRGHIRALEWDGHDLRPGAVVHATEHHVSFPQIYRVAGRWVATVETCAAHNPMLAFDELGAPWRIAGDLPTLPPHMADPVVSFDRAGRPHLVRATDAATSPDAVFVTHQYVTGGWERRAEATYVDVSTARGGGTWDQDRRMRAVQDCASLYGRGLSVVPDSGWFGSAYGEPLAGLTGPEVPSDWRWTAGVHTLTWTPDQDQVWIDGWRRRPAPLGGYRRWVERKHLAECSG